jgi:hypothetical protein
MQHRQQNPLRSFLPPLSPRIPYQHHLLLMEMLQLQLQLLPAVALDVALLLLLLLLVQL